MSGHISLVQLAELAGVSRQAIEKAVARQSREPSALWRGSRLVLRTSLGRGGRSGWSFEVRIDSLPIDLQARLNNHQTPVQLALKLDDAEASARNMRFHIICQVLKTGPGTPERAAATKARAAETFHLNGEVFSASERSIQRWAEKHEAEGFAGLHRKKRKDVRAHWAIENSLHWLLDVTFKEDQSITRKGHGARNMAVVRHFSINLVRQAEIWPSQHAGAPPAP